MQILKKETGPGYLRKYNKKSLMRFKINGKSTLQV